MLPRVPLRARPAVHFVNFRSIANAVPQRRPTYHAHRSDFFNGFASMSTSILSYRLVFQCNRRTGYARFGCGRMFRQNLFQAIIRRHIKIAHRRPGEYSKRHNKNKRQFYAPQSVAQLISPRRHGRVFLDRSPSIVTGKKGQI